MNERETEGVVPYGMGTAIVVTEEQKRVIKNTIFPDSTDDELKLFIFDCQRRGVHPLDKLIHPVLYKDKDGSRKLSLQASIDYLRSLTEESGTFAGMDIIEYGPEETDSSGNAYPAWAKCTGYKYVTAPNGAVEKVPVIGIARWKEFYPGSHPGFMHKVKPYLMIGKCSEAQMRRQGWPRLLKGLYLVEEIASIDEGAPSVSKTESVQPVKKSTPLPPPQQETGTQPKLSVQELLRKELLIHTGMDAEKGKMLIKELSLFTDKNTGKERFATKVDGLSDKWAEKVLETLHKRDPEGSMPQGCTGEVATCDSVAYLLSKAVCTACGDIVCPFGIGISY